MEAKKREFPGENMTIFWSGDIDMPGGQRVIKDFSKDKYSWSHEDMIICPLTC